MDPMAELEIVKLDANDVKEELLAFWAEHRFSSKDTFEWYYLDKLKDQTHLYCLVDDSGNGKIVGTISVSQRDWVYEGKSYKAGVFGNLLIAKSHRTLLPALTLLETVVKKASQDFDILYSFPNKAALLLFRRVGFEKNNAFHRYAKVVRTKRYLAQKFGGLSSVISPFANLGISLLDQYHLLSSKKRKYEILDDFDAAFDELNTRLNTQGRIRSQRGSAFLKWRYLSVPEDNQYRVFVLHSLDGNSIDGYLVYSDITKDKDAYIFDMLVDSEKLSYQQLLLQFSSAMRKLKFNSIAFEFFGDEQLILDLQKIGVSKREKRAVLFKACNTIGEELLEKNMMITAGDENSRD